MSAPHDVQKQAAMALIRRRGTADWAPFNPRLAAALRSLGTGGGGSTIAGDLGHENALHEDQNAGLGDYFRAHGGFLGDPGWHEATIGPGRQVSADSGDRTATIHQTNNIQTTVHPHQIVAALNDHSGTLLRNSRALLT
jgi:hypothetical protein